MSFHKVSSKVRYHDDREPLLREKGGKVRGRTYSPTSGKPGRKDLHSSVSSKTTPYRPLRERSAKPTPEKFKAVALKTLTTRISTDADRAVLKPKQKAPSYKSLQDHQGSLPRNFRGNVSGIGTLPPTGIERTFQEPQYQERLSPDPVDRTGYYEDSGSFSVPFEQFHDKSSYLSNVGKRKEVTEILAKRLHEGATGEFESLDALVEYIYDFRKAKGDPRISEDDKEKQKFYITHSCTNQSDVIARPELSPKMRKQLGVTDDSILAVQHITLKNGFNGLSYKAADGSIVRLTSAVAGSWDRESETIQMGRRIAPVLNGAPDPRAPSYCYTGRPDTTRKALEQGKMIFFGEMGSAQPKGITVLSKQDFNDLDGNAVVNTEIIEVDYVINSIQSTSPLYHLMNTEQEQTYFKEEQKALQELRTDVHKITRDEKTYYVRFRPVLFSRQVNVCANLSKWLDSWSSGEYTSLEATRKGWSEFEQLIHSRLKDLSPDERKLAEQLIKKLGSSINGNTTSQMSEAEELLSRTMLCMLFKLPVVWHCKSSTDRTSVVVAMNVALEQWIKLGHPLPENFTDLLHNEYFKELFAMNWIQGQQLTRNARSPDGVIHLDGILRELDHEALGISINAGLAQCVLLQDLLPARYLKDYGLMGYWKDSWKNFGISAGAFFGSILLGWIPAFIGAVRAPFGTKWQPELNSGWKTFGWILASLTIFLPITAFRFLYNYLWNIVGFAKAVPDNIVDFDALGVGPRLLTKEGKAHQRPFLQVLDAVPSNARDPKKLVEVAFAHKYQSRKKWDAMGLAKMDMHSAYNVLFKQRFQLDEEGNPMPGRRPLRHLVSSNVIKEISDAQDTGATGFRLKKSDLKGPFKSAKVGDLNDGELIKQMRSEMGRGLSVKIDGKSFKDPNNIFQYLTKTKHLSDKGAIQLMRSMQLNAVTYAHSHVSKILNLATDPTSEVITLASPKGTAKINITLDTSTWKLQIEHDEVLKDVTSDVDSKISKDRDIHATIHFKTVLNCEPGSDKFGHGYVAYDLAKTTRRSRSTPEPFYFLDFTA